jgi:hypothetical protein
MTTQKEILKEIEDKGFYSASIFKFRRSVRGAAEVSAAERLESKGLISLSSEKVTIFDGGSMRTLTWTKRKVDV